MSLGLLLVLGLLLNGAAAALVLWRGSVDAGGALAGAVVGTIIFGFGGPLFWVVLMAFFISSTAMSRAGAQRKEPLKRIHQKGSRRDAFQVLANGGAGAVCAILFWITGNPGWAAGFAVSFASSNADTWASELGELSERDPISLLTLRRAPRGVSGGVTPLGTCMAAAGAAFIALVFGLENLYLGALPGGFLRAVGITLVGGFAGAILDSLLGATVQAQYQTADGLVTERPVGPEGEPHRLLRGVRFVNNDVVNFASCTLVTAAAVVMVQP